MAAKQGDMIMQPPVTRRQAVAALGVTSASIISPASVFAAVTPEKIAALIPGASACILTPFAEEGPYYFDPNLERSDMTEGKPGIPLRILFQVIDAIGCAPISGARADIWHADAGGEYSGYASQGDDRKTTAEGQTFLRGTQFTSSLGEATFDTIYPGWYKGRTTHIHFKVFLDTKNVVTGQIYFPDALSEFIYTSVAPYNARTTQRDTANAADHVIEGSGGGHETFCNIKEDVDRYLASLIIGIDRNAEAETTQGGSPPPGKPPTFTPGGTGTVPLDRSKLVPGA